jgi:hypothetical protein
MVWNADVGCDADADGLHEPDPAVARILAHLGLRTRVTARLGAANRVAGLGPSVPSGLIAQPTPICSRADDAARPAFE